MRGGFIKEHGFHRCARIGLFTDRLVLRRIPRRVSMRRRRDGWARILRMRRVVSMRARFSGHVPKGQKFIAQGKRSDTLGIKVPRSLRHARAKVLKQSVLCLLLPLQGVAWCCGLPRVSLRLPWAMEVVGLSARIV